MIKKAFIKELSWALAGAIVCVLVYGYQAYNGDQEEHLPYTFALNDSSLYSRDYLVPQQEAEVTVRFFYAHLMAFVFRIAPEAFALFGVYTLLLALTLWPLLKWISSHNSNPLSYAAGVLVFILFNHFTTGGNYLTDVQLTCSTFAFTACAWAIFLFFRNKYRIAALLCGIASLFQVLFGLQLMMLFLFTLLCTFAEPVQIRLRNASMMLLSYLAVAGFILVPLLIRQIGNSMEDVHYYKILFDYRNAHHYFPACFPPMDYIRTIFLWILGFFCLNKMDSAFSIRFRLMMTGTVLGCIVYTVLFSGLNAYTAGKLQAFKSCVFISYLALLPIGIYLTGQLPRFSKPALRASAVFPVLLALSGLAIILNSKAIPIEKLRFRYKIANYPESDLERMHHWIRKNTPTDALFVTFAGDDSFLSEARRSLVVGYKGIIHTPDFMLPWYKRMQHVYKTPYLKDACTQNVLARADSMYRNIPDSLISAHYTFDFRLWKGKVGASGMIVLRQGDYILTRSSLSNPQ